MGRPPDRSTSDASDLDSDLRTAYELAEAMVSVTSISSTLTASDLPGPGRLLGNFYSYLGRRLENVLNRLMERLGFGPAAIEEYCMSMRHDGVLAPGSKKDKELQKKLDRLLRYAESEENRELACEVIVHIVIARPDFISTLCCLDAVKRLAIADIREQRVRGLCDGPLLSVPRIALVSVHESDLNAAGREWINLHRTYRTHLSVSREQFGRLALSSMETLMRFMCSQSPEETYLAYRYFATSAISQCLDKGTFRDVFDVKSGAHVPLDMAHDAHLLLAQQENAGAEVPYLETNAIIAIWLRVVLHKIEEEILSLHRSCEHRADGLIQERVLPESAKGYLKVLSLEIGAFVDRNRSNVHLVRGVLTLLNEIGSREHGGKKEVWITFRAG